MKYDHKDATPKCFPEGQYAAVLQSVTDTTEAGEQLMSKKGEEMEYLTFEVYDDQGQRSINLRNYITKSTAAWQYKRLAAAVDDVASYEADTFSPKNHIGANFVVELEVEEYNGKDQNRIKKILPKQGGSPAKSTPATGGKKFNEIKPGELDDDQIPF